MRFLLLAIIALSGCASAPEGSAAWFIGAPGKRVLIEGTDFKVVQAKNRPDIYYAASEGSEIYVNADAQYLNKGRTAIERVSGCRTLEAVLSGGQVQAEVRC